MSEQGVFTRFEAYDFDKDDRFHSGLEKLIQEHQDKNDSGWLLRTKLFYYNKFIEPISVAEYLKQFDIKRKPEDRAQSMTSKSEILESLTEDVARCHLSVNSNKKTVPVAVKLTADSDVSSINSHSAMAEGCKKEHHVADDMDPLSYCTDPVTRISGNNRVASSDKNKQLSCQKVLTLVRDEVSHEDLRPTSPISCGTESDLQTETTEDILTFAQVIDYIQKGQEPPGLKELNIKPTNQKPTESVISRKAKPWENAIIQ